MPGTIRPETAEIRIFAINGQINGRFFLRGQQPFGDGQVGRNAVFFYLGRLRYIGDLKKPVDIQAAVKYIITVKTDQVQAGNRYAAMLQDIFLIGYVGDIHRLVVMGGAFYLIDGPTAVFLF